MRVLLVIAATAVTSPVSASSPAAMAEGLVATKAACRKASDLKNAAVLGAPVMFSDATGKTAVLVTGIWRPAQMNCAPATLLCPYDRASRTAEVEEARRWAAPKN